MTEERQKAIWAIYGKKIHKKIEMRINLVVDYLYCDL